MGTPSELDISVVLPTRDSLTTLPAAVDSVLEQRDVRLELIVVDDGSRDGTASWLARRAERDPRVGILSTDGAGLVPALNLGWQASRAPLIARMDADDISLPGRLASQRDWLDEHPEASLVGCLARAFPEHEIREGMRRYIAWQNGLVTHEEITREIFVEAPLVHPSVTIRRDALRSVGGYRDRGWPEDYDLWLRLYAKGHRFGKVPHELFLWREHPKRLTRTAPAYKRERHWALKAHYLARTVLAQHGEVQIWGAGRDGKRLGRLLSSEGIRVVRYFDVDPNKIGGKIKSIGGQDTPVLAWSELKTHHTTPTLVAVGSRGVRATIRAAIEELQFTEGVDLWFTA